MKSLLVLSLFTLIFHILSAQNINIKLFSKQEYSAFTFTTANGKYELVSRNKIAGKVAKSDSIIVFVKGKKFRAVDAQGQKLGNFKHLQIRGIGAENRFLLRVHSPGVVAREYDDDLQIFCTDGLFSVINDVDFEKYIAAVVECEGGPSSHIEYYKSQAILCRTYAMRHHEKHIEEGFSLCDDVHCQAYKHRCMYNRDIYAAAQETAGLVIVDNKLKLISATFYSNSGGQTANSEDVWSSALPYLRSQADPFSEGMRNYRWQKEIPMSEWNDYLQKKGISVGKEFNYNFAQPQRKKEYQCEGTVIPTKTIRQDWNLKSSFFDIKRSGDKIIIDGKGYGHGVGLAQEGAMNMANKGYGYEQIIKQYYQGVNIMSIRALNFFQVE